MRALRKGQAELYYFSHPLDDDASGEQSFFKCKVWQTGRWPSRPHICNSAFNLPVFNVRRASTFAFEQSKRTAISGSFICVDKSRDLPLLYVVEDFTGFVE